MALWLTTDDDANRLLDSDPFALLIGMTLDQQFQEFGKLGAASPRWTGRMA